MHMSGAPAVSSVAARTLPVPDLFSPPGGNVLVGLDTEDFALLPRLRARMDQSQEGHQAPRSVTVDRDQRFYGGLAAAVAARVHAGQQALSGNDGGGGGGGGMKPSDSGAGGLTACVSGVAGVRDSPLCDKTRVRTVDTAVVAAGMEEKQVVEALKSRCGTQDQSPLAAVVTGGYRKQPVALEVSTSSDAKASTSSSGAPAAITSTASSMPSVVFSMEDPVERAFLLELERVSRVPSELGPTLSEVSRARLQSPAEQLEPPPMVVITLGSLSLAAWEGKEGGEEKRQVAHDLADRVLDNVLSELAVPRGKGLGAGLVAHVLFDGRGQPAASNDGTSHKNTAGTPGRGKETIRLLVESSGTPSPMPTTATAGANYDLIEISNYQICLWTAIALVLALLSAICCMVNMDVRPDSLLYAKFQADVSSKIE